MAGLLEKASFTWLLDNCPPGLLAIIFIVFLVLWLSYRVNKLITNALSKEQAQTDEIAALRAENLAHGKQQRKNAQMLSALPCVTKENGLWLGDTSRNGGQPPERIECHHIKDKRSQ